MSRQRLDREVVDRGLARSRSQAQAMISAGAVRVDGRTELKAAQLVEPGAEIEAVADRYVSRAAHKLLGALDDLGLAVAGRALDAGASTGGFTQVLLERGCTEVVAVDVGTDQLDPSLRYDPRVLVREQTNLRDLRPDLVGGQVDLVVADVSFISLTLLIGPLSGVTTDAASMLVMVKPQFEVGRNRLGKGGVVREPALHREAVAAVLVSAADHGWALLGAVPSRWPGPAGNREFFLHLGRGPAATGVDLDSLVRPGPAGPVSSGAYAEARD